MGILRFLKHKTRARAIPYNIEYISQIVLPKQESLFDITFGYIGEHIQRNIWTLLV